MQKQTKQWHRLYRVLRWCVKTVYPKITLSGVEQLPPEPCIIVGNHCQMHGPIACELYAPGQHVTWCAGEMMQRKEVPDYAFRDFWGEKPRHLRWFYRLLSYAIAPLSAVIFNNANTIGVYHDARLMSTFRSTLARLEEGASIIIFPEGPQPGNHIVNQFQERFVDVARMYYRRTGKVLSFVPMYLAPALKTMTFGAPVVFDPAAPAREECTRVCHQLHAAITDLAMALPRHTVVPYRNLPKNAYPCNLPKELPDEKACR